MRNCTILSLLCLTLAAASCSYYTYPISVERRGPSRAKVDLGGRSMSVSFVYLSSKDSLFQSRLAEGFAGGLEKEYFEEENAVEIFAIKKLKVSEYDSRDTLVNLVMDTNADVAFLFDLTDFTLGGVRDTLSYKVNLYSYDSLEKRDTVRRYYGKRNYDSSNVNQGYQVGEAMAESFAPIWTSQTNYIYLYDDDPWQAAGRLSADLKWKEALGAWCDIVSGSKNADRKATASYNAALCCYMLGDNALATKWLQMAEKYNPELPQIAVLRKRISLSI